MIDVCKRPYICYDGKELGEGKQTVLRRQRIRTTILIAVAIAMATAGLHGSTSYAVANSNVPATNNVLKVSPVRTDVSIAAGSSKVVTATVTNLTTAPLTISTIENDFIAGDEKGTPSLILDATQYAPTHSLKRFMAPIGDVTIPAGKAVTISVTITVPSTAQAGGYFGALRFAPSTQDTGGQVNLSASVASLILLTVPGPTVEKLTLTNFDIQQNGTSGSNFRTPDNLTFAIRLQNSGNLQEAPFGQVTVKSGNTTVSTYDFNQTAPHDVVLPDSARRWDIPLKNVGTFGYYTVYGTFTYGANNQSLDVQKSFWVIPTWAFIVAGVALLVLIGLIVLFIVLMRLRRNRKARRASNRGNLRY